MHLRSYLTLPGRGALRSPTPPAPPPPPPAPAPAPTMVEAESSRKATDARRRQQRLQQGISGSVRNIGGARGVGMETADTSRALKALTGQ